MRLTIIYLLLVLLSFNYLQSNLYAQSSQAMYYLNFPRSIYGLGMGEQTVALKTSEDALAYNPANLVFTEGPTVSFFHQPFQMASYLWGKGLPINGYSTMFKIKNIGSIGIEYINWDWGESTISTFQNPEGDGKLYSIYERSFSLGYAREFCEEFSAGIQFRYAKSNFGVGSAEKLFVSVGLNYSPQIWDNKFNIGFSLTNLGTPVWYVDEAQSDPPPTKLNVGIGFLPIENNFFSLQTQLAISKVFDRGPIENGKIPKSESSFKTLFTDWSEFPDDATLHTGIGFNWKPLNLGNGFSFFQEFYIGNYSVGVKAGLNNFYTHGGKIGIEFSGLKFTAGYAGRWHNVHYPNYAIWRFPYETVQFTLGVNEDLLFGNTKNVSKNPKPENIILSLGMGRSFSIGKFNERLALGFMGISEGFENGNTFFIEGAFYLNEQNAVVSNISYNPADYIGKYKGQEIFRNKVEIFAISSLYRYHPFNLFLPLFIQGGLSIVRLNPTSPFLYPKYDYKTALLFSIGANFEVYEGIILTPFANYNLLLSKDGNSAPRLGGFNQFDLGLKVGYKF